MFSKRYEDRLSAWRDFRLSLEKSSDPLQDVIDLYAKAPMVSIATDPWDQKTWPQPWQLLQENEYCDFTTVLGMCFSLQLTDRFFGSKFEIHISTDYEKSESYYLLFVDNIIIGYKHDTYITLDKLPNSVISQRIYPMPELQ